ncbi:regulatory protein RecX [Parafrigoribacterium soli]|uniref:regulatory protein RecX n=1 Tax=Parafrigoribacterium soli TaxID=3144663 RepID=UPI0032ED79B0
MTSGDGLARVSYLPGVLPPIAGDPEPVPSSESALPDRAASKVRFTDLAETVEPGEQSTPESDDAQRQRAEKVSMQALTRRGQSRWELQKALLARELDSEIVEAELDRLERVGLIDDAELAETLVRTQHERKGLGRSALTAELRRRHIDQQYIDEALEQVDDDDEQSRATELAVRRAPQLRSLDTETAKRRLSGFLMRKGYAGSVVRAAVDEALSSHGGHSSGVRFR